MNGNGIGQLQLLQLLKAVIHHFALVKFHGQLFRKGIDLADDADVSVENSGTGIHRDSIAIAGLPLNLIIIFDLHDLISDAIDGSAHLFFRFRRILRV